MRAGLILVSVALGGCATTSTTDLRHTSVAATFKSAKPPAELAACLAEGLNQWGAPAIYSANGSTTVSFTTDGNTLLLFDISPDGGVTVRRATGVVSFREKTEACL